MLFIEIVSLLIRRWVCFIYYAINIDGRDATANGFLERACSSLLSSFESCKSDGVPSSQALAQGVIFVAYVLFGCFVYVRICVVYEKVSPRNIFRDTKGNLRYLWLTRV